jgi:superoxide reductase
MTTLTMPNIKEMFQSADWKSEKHVPVIEGKDKFNKGELISLTITIGKEIPHPNTTAHHIRWVNVYFLPHGEKFPYEIGHFEFNAHGESAQGADTSTVYAHHEVTVYFKTDKPGTVMASSYCNIHGLWGSEKNIVI